MSESANAAISQLPNYNGTLTDGNIIPVVQLGVLPDNGAAQAPLSALLTYVGKANLSTGFSLSGGTASKTLTVTQNATIDQDLQQSASPTWAAINITGLTASQYVKTDGSKNLVSQNGIPASDLTGTTLPSNITLSSITRTGLSAAGYVKTDASGNLSNQVGVPGTDLTGTSLASNIINAPGTSWTIASTMTINGNSITCTNPGNMTLTIASGQLFQLSNAAIFLQAGDCILGARDGGPATGSMFNNSYYFYPVLSDTSLRVNVKFSSGGTAVYGFNQSLFTNSDVNFNSATLANYLSIGTLRIDGGTPLVSTISSNTLVTTFNLAMTQTSQADTPLLQSTLSSGNVTTALVANKLIASNALPYSSDKGAVYVMGTDVNATNTGTPVVGRHKFIGIYCTTSSSGITVSDQSGGIASAVRNGVGDYTINFDTGVFSGAPYPVCEAYGGPGSVYDAYIKNGVPPTASSVTIQTTASGSLSDGIFFYVHIVGPC